MIFTDYCKGIFNALIPPTCLVCGKRRDEKAALCDRCMDFKPNTGPFCEKCGLSACVGLKGGLCRRCQRANFHFTRNLSPFLFEKPLSQAIYLFKYSGYDWLGEVFADKLVKFINTADISLDSYDYITFVPLHRRKLREREYNQSRILAGHIAANFGLVFRDALGVREYRQSQSKQNYQQRKMSVSDNFFMKSDVKGEGVILVDDVFTTGATASECAKALKEKGVKEILSLTLCIRSLNPKDDEDNPKLFSQGVFK